MDQHILDIYIYILVKFILTIYEVKYFLFE